METVSWKVEMSPQAVHLRVRGELDLASAPAVDGELRRVEGSAELLVVDLREVSFIDSGGLRVLLLADMRAEQDARRMAIVPSPQVRRALDALVSVARGRIRGPAMVDDPTELHRGTRGARRRVRRART